MRCPRIWFFTVVLLAAVTTDCIICARCWLEHRRARTCALNIFSMCVVFHCKVSTHGWFCVRPPPQATSVDAALALTTPIRRPKVVYFLIVCSPLLTGWLFCRSRARLSVPMQTVLGQSTLTRSISLPTLPYYQTRLPTLPLI